jgi:hypothetical protein
LDKIKLFKEYLKLLNRLYEITWFGSVYEKRKLTQTRLYKYKLLKIYNIPYNLIFTTKFTDSSILITFMSCDYLNLLLAYEHVGDVTIPTQVIKYDQNFLQVE